MSLITSFVLQSHIRVLETNQENIAALLMGLEYLISISYVDDTEVFKVLYLLYCPLGRLNFQNFELTCLVFV